MFEGVSKHNGVFRGVFQVVLEVFQAVPGCAGGVLGHSGASQVVPRSTSKKRLCD